MDGEVNVCVLSSMCPWLVPAQANARLGSVSVGTEENHWSQTAYPRASPESTGRVCGAKQPMMSWPVVPATMDQPPSRDCHPSVYVKSLMKPSLDGVTDELEGADSLPNNWSLVAM